jgi:NAD(P)-dependent dehydrogenase (short-subunit alcohol dehydrogenase family)
VVSQREIVVVGGTGMLRPAVHDLLAEGARTLVVARRPERVASDTPDDQHLVPVAADWSAPDALGEAIRTAVEDPPVDEAVLWIHTPYDQGVHEAIDPLLSSTATVVQLWGSAGVDPRESRPWPTQYRPPRSYRRVILGFADGSYGTRWLTDREISDGALRQLEDPASEQVVGRVEPWSARP